MDSTETKATPPASRVQPVVRVRAAWRDWCAGHVFLLEEYIPPSRFLWWKTKGRWENRTMATESILHAEEWCKHYGVKIEWDNDHNAELTRTADCRQNGRNQKERDEI